MPSKNNLTALKQTRTAILPANADPASAEPAQSPAKKRVGRPNAKAGEKRNYKVTLSLTQGEGAKLAERAGLAGEATVIYDFLKKNGFFD